jgi:hypothetical protein
MNNDRIAWHIGHLQDPIQVEHVRHQLQRDELIYGDSAFTIHENGDVEVLDPTTIVVEPPAAPAEKPAEKKSDLDEAKDDAEPKDAHGGSKPPDDGLCRECRQPRKLNRLRLCYPCFVELVIMDEAKKRGHEWKSGDKHPDWCSCEGLGEHPERDHGAWRGN